MINLQASVNTQVNLPFVANGNATGQTGFAHTLLKDGVVDATTVVSFQEVGGGLYVASFTPTSTGTFVLFVETTIAGQADVFTKAPSVYLENIENALLGSWNWDKQAGTITMYTQTGTVLATFTATSTSTVTSRERN